MLLFAITREKCFSTTRRPEGNPGRKEYTPFTRPLEQPRKPVDQMRAEEFAIAAEFKLKELDSGGRERCWRRHFGRILVIRARISCSGSTISGPGGRRTRSRTWKKRSSATLIPMMRTTTSRWLSSRAGGSANERNLYYIWPESAHFGAREYQLGRLVLQRGELDSAAGHFRRALDSDAETYWRGKRLR